MPSPERMTRPSEYQPAGRSATERWDKQVRAVGNQAVDTLVEQAPPGTHAVHRIDCGGIAGRLRDRHVGAAGAPPVEMQRGTAELDQGPIGRAACRESVCQDV